MFVSGNFNVQPKDWLTYSHGTDKPGELCYNSPALLDLFLFSDTSICSKRAFPPLENSGHIVVSFLGNFPIK